MSDGKISRARSDSLLAGFSLRGVNRVGEVRHFRTRSVCRINNRTRPGAQMTVLHFWSLIMLAVTAGAFLLVVFVGTKALFVFLQESPIP